MKVTTFVGTLTTLLACTLLVALGISDQGLPPGHQVVPQACNGLTSVYPVPGGEITGYGATPELACHSAMRAMSEFATLHAAPCASICEDGECPFGWFFQWSGVINGQAEWSEVYGWSCTNSWTGGQLHQTCNPCFE